MKKSYVLLLVGLTLLFPITALAEMQYLGKVCLNLSQTNGGTEVLQLDVLSYGTNVFPVYGKIASPVSGGSVSVPLHGSAVLDSNAINFTLNASRTTTGLGPIILSSTYSIELRFSSGSGVFSMYKYEPTMLSGSPDPFNIVSAVGTATFQQCP